MSDATEAATRMGARAGASYRADGVPRRNPIQAPRDDTTTPLAAVRDAWDKAYVDAAYVKDSAAS
jgi:hypothetical protein